MTERETLRLHPPIIFWWVWVAFVVANVVDYAAQGLPSARFGSLLAAVLLLVTGVVYTLALRPKVISGGDGLTVVNPFRVHHLPWPVIDSVDTGEWVRVRYAEPAAGRRDRHFRVVHCWALYVSTRARRKVAVGDAADAAPACPGGCAAWSRPRRPATRSRPPGSPTRPCGWPPLPVSAAIAARLDARAEKERKRAEANGGRGEHGRRPPGPGPPSPPSPSPPSSCSSSPSL